jgi:hypothetical protein
LFNKKKRGIRRGKREEAGRVGKGQEGEGGKEQSLFFFLIIS